MDTLLLASACGLGLAGLPHCAAMCAAPCAAVCGGAPQGLVARSLVFQLARMASYGTAGALAAASVGALASLSQWSPAVRPLWALFHAAVLSLGLWFVWQGRQPDWMGRLAPGSAPRAVTGMGWQALRGPLRSAGAGAAWVVWPCGLLQSALLMASLANTPMGGAVVMLGFALSSSAGLLAGPWLWAQIRRGRLAGLSEAGLIRASGVLLVAGSGFALINGVWHQLAAFCGWA